MANGKSLLKSLNYSIYIIIFLIVVFVSPMWWSQWHTRSIININTIRTEPAIVKGVESTALIKAVDDRVTILQESVNLELKNYATRVATTEEQIVIVNSMLSNMLTIVTVILTMFTLLIGIMGFYLSKVINEKYDNIRNLFEDIKHREIEIKDLENEIKTLIEDSNEALYNRIIYNDNIAMLKTLIKHPANINNIFGLLSTRDIHGEEMWSILKTAFLNLFSSDGDSPYYDLTPFLCLIFQFYPEKIVNKEDTNVTNLILKYNGYCNRIGFFKYEIINVIKAFSGIIDDNLVVLFVELIIKNSSLDGLLAKGDSKVLILQALNTVKNSTPKLRECIDKKIQEIDKPKRSG